MKLAHYSSTSGTPASGFIIKYSGNKKHYAANIQKPVIGNVHALTIGQSVFNFLVTGSDRSTTYSSASDPTLTIRDTDVLVFDVDTDSPSKLFNISLTETGTIAVPTKHTLLNNNVDSGVVKFYPGVGNTGTYYYRASNDSNFKGVINVTGNPTTAVLSGSLVVPSSSNLSGTTNTYFHGLINNTNVNDIVYTWSLTGSTGNARGSSYGRKYRLETFNITGIFGQTETFYVNVTASSIFANSSTTNSGIVILNHIASGTVPSQIAGLSISSGVGGQLGLSWVLPSDGGYPIQDYIVKVGSTGIDGFGNPVTNETVYNDGVGTGLTATITGLTNGNQYFFAVGATNDLGTGVYSASGTGMPASVPSNVAAPFVFTTGNTQIGVNWNEPANNGNAISDYVIQYSGQNAGGPPITYNDGVSSISSGSITGLINGTGYFVSIAAINTIGTGTFSSFLGPVVPSG
jgi:hypothetical protein